MMIAFKGGPKDGETLPWTGGDRVEFTVPEPVAVVNAGSGLLTTAETRYVYRRSSYDPDVFEYTP